MQAEEPGCMAGCATWFFLLPILAVFQYLFERDKEKDKQAAEKLEARNRVLRLEAERERLKTEREDALAARKRRKMLDAGYVRCTRCREMARRTGRRWRLRPVPYRSGNRIAME